MNPGSVTEVPPRDYVNRSRPRPLHARRMKRASNEKECRALMASRLRSNSISSCKSGSKAARLSQPIAARVTVSRKAETGGNQEKRHRHGRNNFGATNTIGSGM